MRLGVLRVELDRLLQLGDRARRVAPRDLRLGEADAHRRRLGLSSRSCMSSDTARSTCPAATDCSALADLDLRHERLGVGVVLRHRRGEVGVGQGVLRAVLRDLDARHLLVRRNRAGRAPRSASRASARPRRRGPDLRSTVARPIRGARSTSRRRRSPACRSPRQRPCRPSPPARARAPRSRALRPPAAAAFCASAIASSGLPSWTFAAPSRSWARRPRDRRRRPHRPSRPPRSCRASSCATDMRPSASPLAAPLSVAEAALYASTATSSSPRLSRSTPSLSAAAPFVAIAPLEDLDRAVRRRRPRASPRRPSPGRRPPAPARLPCPSSRPSSCRRTRRGPRAAPRGAARRSVSCESSGRLSGGSGSGVRCDAPRC